MEDNDIVALLWERQEPALAHLQDKYSTYLMQITRRIIIDEEDAKECVNDVWLKVWNSIPPGKPKHLAGYLAKIARNLALDKYRQHNAAKRGGDTWRLVLKNWKNVFPVLTKLRKRLT